MFQIVQTWPMHPIYNLTEDEELQVLICEMAAMGFGVSWPEAHQFIDKKDEAHQFIDKKDEPEVTQVECSESQSQDILI